MNWVTHLAHSVFSTQVCPWHYFLSPVPYCALDITSSHQHPLHPWHHFLSSVLHCVLDIISYFSNSLFKFRYFRSNMIGTLDRKRQICSWVTGHLPTMCKTLDPTSSSATRQQTTKGSFLGCACNLYGRVITINIEMLHCLYPCLELTKLWREFTVFII